MDETFVRIAGEWMYLCRAVDSHGQTVDLYSPQHATARRPSGICREHWPIPATGPRTSSLVMACAVIQAHSENCKLKVACRHAVAREPAATVITGSNQITVTSSAAYVRSRGTDGDNRLGGDSEIETTQINR